MKVWIVIGSYDDEGYSPPESAHASRESADKARKALDVACYRHIAVFEMEVVVDAD